MAAVLKNMMAVALFSAPLLLPADRLPAADQIVIVSVPGIPGPYWESWERAAPAIGNCATRRASRPTRTGGYTSATFSETASGRSNAVARAIPRGPARQARRGPAGKKS